MLAPQIDSYFRVRTFDVGLAGGPAQGDDEFDAWGEGSRLFQDDRAPPVTAQA
jgi:hypothetical protein